MNLTDLLAILDNEEKKVATEEEFQKAAEDVKTIKVMNTEQQLLLYALYKQATVGDVKTDKPSFLDFTGSSKW
jgi:diazepam-binding inhibitor (GABA receptor modulating acyl-CoA-binding protein)